MNPTGQFKRIVAFVMAFAMLALVMTPIATTVSAAEPSPLATLGYSLFLGHNFAPASTTPPPTPTPQPTPDPPCDDDDGPSIVVLTEFPDGPTITTFVDVDYIATPSEGAYITHVFLYRNDGLQILYRAASVAPQLGQHGVLGQARVLIFGGENRIIFIVRDSAGLEYEYEVENRPYMSFEGTERDLPFGTTGPQAREFREYFVDEDGEEYWVYTHLLSLWTHVWERDFDTLHRINEIVAPLGGEVAAYRITMGYFVIILPGSTRAELMVLGASLMEEHPELFRLHSVITGKDAPFDPLMRQDIRIPDDPSWGIQERWLFRRYTHWNLRYTNFPEAWAAWPTQGGRPRNSIRVGIVDGGVYYMFVITNTSNEEWPHWVLSMNRPLGLNEPTAWGESWQNNGLFVYQDFSETTIRNLGHQAPVMPGESVEIHTYSNSQQFYMPTDFRLRAAERRLVPMQDRTYEVLVHSEWGNNFNHAISIVNTSNRAIQNWEIHFGVLGGGMSIDSAPNAEIVQTTSGSAILLYVPGGGQVLHPGQNLHMGMIGTFVPGSTITNVRIYERIGTAYGGWPDFVPGQPGTTPPPWPTPTPPPNGNGNGDDDEDGPSIVVLTEFPNGITTTLAVDIEYTATPGDGAYIREVFFTNGGRTQYIYVSGTIPRHWGQRGVLGEATIPLFGGENDIVFTVRDSNGQEDTHVVDTLPVIWWDTLVQYSPLLEEDNIGQPGPGGEPWAAQTRLMFTLTPQNSYAGGIQRANDAFAPLGGSVIGFNLVVRMVTVEVLPHNREEMTALGERMLREYPDLFSNFHLIGLAVNNSETADPWWEETWGFFRPPQVQWGLSASNYSAVGTKVINKAGEICV